ncbi:MAG: 2-amino-4-hydroxy-6-hydroxymethyldihydropteridine diphosphokinase [Lachnospiraceae bacterium]|nr:2-amino-4-hydroxy-6-hydroxymethyldihydropteridine diphosphokinase [Lachnospiraceae bacterium]
MKDYSEIKIEGLRCFAHHGVYKTENETGQNFYIDCTLYQDTKLSADSDDIDRSTNYGTVCYFIDNWMRKNTYKLIESVAERLSEAILHEFPYVCSLDLEIKKPEAPIKLDFASVSVKVHRGWHSVYMGIGSNMGDREDYIQNALGMLEERGDIRIERISTLIETEPYGYTEQGKFINGAIKLKTYLSPSELLKYVKEIEKRCGREKTVHWGPRTLDLDILFYDDLVYSDDVLVIPHIDMENREFVLLPLSEIAPNYRNPLNGRTVTEMLNALRAHQNG